MTTYYAPALDKGLDILEFLSDQSKPLSQLEIATGINRKPNEIYRMLVSLEKRGYIAKDKISGKYSLTLRLFQLAHHHSPVDTIVKTAEIHISNLVNTINQSVHLGILHHNKLMIIAQAKSNTPVSLSVEIGSMFPLDKTNSGKIILANLESNKRDQILELCESFSSIPKSEQDDFCSQLDLIRGKICRNQKSELTEGVTDFAAPIFNMRNEVVAVLTVSALTSQMRKIVTPSEIEKELLKAVKCIGEDLGIA